MIPERADEKVLYYIYEYLQWIGMKQTCSVLLSESPVKIDVSREVLSKVSEPEFMPKLSSMMLVTSRESRGGDNDSTVNLSIDRGHCSDVIAASAEGVPPPAATAGTGKAGDEPLQPGDDLRALVNNGSEVRIVSTGNGRERSGEKVGRSHEESEERLIEFSFEEPKEDTLKQDDVKSSSNSKKEPLSVVSLFQPSEESTPIRPALNGSGGPGLNVTFTPENPIFPFESKRATNNNNNNADKDKPIVTSSLGKMGHSIFSPEETPLLNRLIAEGQEQLANLSLNRDTSSISNGWEDSSGGGNEDEEGLVSSRKDDEEEAPQSNASKPFSNGEFKTVKSSPDSDANQNVSNVDKNSNVNSGRKSSAGKDSYPSNEFEDLSTSDMLSIEIDEDDTQDISIPTDTVGMSSCEHVVSLK
jgi:hypothetical protein